MKFGCHETNMSEYGVRLAQQQFQAAMSTKSLMQRKQARQLLHVFILFFRANDFPGYLDAVRHIPQHHTDHLEGQGLVLGYGRGCDKGGVV